MREKIVTIARTLGIWVVVIGGVALQLAFVVTGYLYWSLHNQCRVGQFRIVQDEKEFAPVGPVVCGDREGWFYIEAGGAADADTFVIMGVGMDDPSHKRFEFRNGVYLDGQKCDFHPSR